MSNEARIEAILKEIGDVKIVMASNRHDMYWAQYLKMLENELIELSLLGDVMTDRAEVYKGFRDDGEM